ncbi:MAG: DUF1674 domain-containing protein [Acidocella sp.]|nr:DUF1674 domain-containing protein [Acidocella sp.]
MMMSDEAKPGKDNAELKPEVAGVAAGAVPQAALAKEIGGQKGPEPTRYGDWEKNGRCTDF